MSISGVSKGCRLPPQCLDNLQSLHTCGFCSFKMKLNGFSFVIPAARTEKYITGRKGRRIRNNVRHKKNCSCEIYVALSPLSSYPATSCASSVRATASLTAYVSIPDPESNMTISTNSVHSTSPDTPKILRCGMIAAWTATCSRTDVNCLSFLPVEYSLKQLSESFTIAST